MFNTKRVNGGMEMKESEERYLNELWLRRLKLGEGAHYRYGNPADHRAREVFYIEAGKNKPKSILDVGCGMGQDSLPIQSTGAKYVGVDPLEANLEVARRRNPEGDFRYGVVQRLPFPDLSFDWIWMSGVWEELPKKDIKEAVMECLRVARYRIYSIDARSDYHLTLERLRAIPLPYSVKLWRVSYDPVKQKNFRMWLIDKEEPLYLKPVNPEGWGLDGIQLETEYHKYDEYGGEIK